MPANLKELAVELKKAERDWLRAAQRASRAKDLANRLGRIYETKNKGYFDAVLEQAQLDAEQTLRDTRGEEDADAS